MFLCAWRLPSFRPRPAAVHVTQPRVPLSGPVEINEEPVNENALTRPQDYPADLKGFLSGFQEMAQGITSDAKQIWNTTGGAVGGVVRDGDALRIKVRGATKIVAIDTKGVTMETSGGKELRLSRGDPMLKRMDLAYALNAHMAQGLTSDRGIAVMDSRERNLANRQTFLVTVTRLRDGLTLIADNAEALGRAIKSNSGEKASALEVTQRLKAAAAKGLSQDKDVGSTSPASDKPELTKERVKPFEIGI